MEHHLVILAGGISSRMKKTASSATGIDPILARDASIKSKSMIGVGERQRPLMDYLLYNAREAGYRNIVIVIGEHDHSIREYYQQHPFHGLELCYVIQPIPNGRTKPLGTADALLRVLNTLTEWQGQKFTVCNSDNIYSRNALYLLREHPGCCSMIDYDRDALQYDQKRIEQFSIIQKDGDGFLTRIVEKPSSEDISRAMSTRGRIGISMNIFRFSYDCIYPVLERIPLHPIRQEKELPNAVTILVEEHPRSVFTIPLSEYVPDLTYPSDIPQVQDYLKREFPHFIQEQE